MPTTRFLVESGFVWWWVCGCVCGGGVVVCFLGFAVGGICVVFV